MNGSNSFYGPICVAAGERLTAVIRRSRGCANKDLARLADQTNALCDKLEK